MKRRFAAMVAGGLLAGMVPQAGADDAAAGEAVVKARCVMCHSHDRLLTIAARVPAEQRAAKWEKFLPSHNLPDADDRKQVIAYLLNATRK